MVIRRMGMDQPTLVGMKTLTNVWTTARTELRARGQRHAADQVLRRELAAYTSAADRYELDAIIARSPDEEEAERLERIVSRLRAA